MTMLQLALSWYCLLGAVWGYLVTHEYVTGGKYNYIRTHRPTKALVVGIVGAVVVAIIWPVSLLLHARAGKLRDLFVT